MLQVYIGLCEQCFILEYIFTYSNWLVHFLIHDSITLEHSHHNLLVLATCWKVVGTQGLK